ncbi:Uncharacterised protein [Serratia proteamaculans]|nr:Uncharacterised protein [Serratia proteamaculans]CAI1904183.1 Uncharacterised protein [Serratia proteamaculans]CAI1909316.1 Uncharacterised protein [Serratia proteamaculans]CAI1942590.1 Uncharacterised protein [Serratia proteamaculans]
MEGYPSISHFPRLFFCTKNGKNAYFLRILLILTPKIALIADRLNLRPH